jgi:signal recognition particle subunit SRP54
MTKEERRRPELINGARRKRIAAGAGTTVQEVNKVLTNFNQMRDMMKMMASGKMPGMGGGGRMPPMPGMNGNPLAARKNKKGKGGGGSGGGSKFRLPFGR